MNAPRLTSNADTIRHLAQVVPSFRTTIPRIGLIETGAAHLSPRGPVIPVVIHDATDPSRAFQYDLEVRELAAISPDPQAAIAQAVANLEPALGACFN